MAATNQSSKSATNIEISKQLYSAINRHDVPAALELFDPQIERVEAEGVPGSGTYRGLAEMKTHLAQSGETWAEGSCEPEQFVVAGNKIIVFLHVRVRLKDKVEWIDARIADVLTFRNGKIIGMRTFIEKQKALEWAGV